MAHFILRILVDNVLINEKVRVFRQRANADVNFPLSGILHGVFSVITRWQKEAILKQHPVLNWIFTFSFVNIAWVLFRANSVADALTLVNRILVMDFGPISESIVNAFLLPELQLLIRHIPALSYFTYHPATLVLIFYTGAMALILGARNAHEHMDTFRPTAKNFLGITLLLVWCVMSFSGVSTFLYFNF